MNCRHTPHVAAHEHPVARLVQKWTPSVVRWPLLLVVIAVQVTLRPVLATDIDFNRDVRPILADNCFECHGPDEDSRAADLRLDVLDDAVGWVIEPGMPAESTLIQRLLSDDDDVMPPPELKRRPTAGQIETLRKWIAQGADYEQHWAFVPPSRADAPRVSRPEWLRNEVDAFVLAHLDSYSLEPRPDAEPTVLARRLSLALTGLPLLPQRSDRFASAYEDDPEGAVSTFVDELLASPTYGEHRAWFWMDAARYADTNGYQADGHRVMWPWRDWLIRSLNDDLPFDQLTEQMLAGDLLVPQEQQGWQSADWIPDDRASELLVATGFLRNHRYDTGSGTIPAESKFENAADRMETMGTVWMGMTMLCARCHTHKYDPIENREYYELLSFFDNVREAGSALKGASHPYIHTSTAEGRTELKQLSARADEADMAIAAAEPELAAAQTQWEHDLADGTIEGGSSSVPAVAAINEGRVQRGVRFQYTAETVQFDGETSIEESNDPVALCAGNRRWTISFWFRPETNADCTILSSVQEPDRYRQGIQADWINSRIRLRHVCRWVNSYIEFESVDPFEVGRWHHVTFRCDGRMQGIAYSASVNGRDDAMVCTHPVTNDSADKAGDAPLVLGNGPFLPGFVGGLRDLRFYDRLITPDEVASLADARSTAEIARTPRADRDPVEATTLRLAFLESDGLPDQLRALRDRQLSAREKLNEAIRNSPTTMVMQEAGTKPTRVRLAGVFDSLGDKVETDTPDFLPPLPEGRRDRLALARWLVNAEHPLTARVAVNRIWQTLWGRGFVDSPENFGTQCAEPLQADLLDWLATEYIRLGWDTKALIKLIVTSRAYRQRSDAPEELWQRDPQNRHLARGPRFRLPVSVVRDQALSLSGRLEPTIGGPPVIVDEVIGQNGKPMMLPCDKSDRRRTLYTFWKRNSPHPLLAVFDVADRNQCEVRTMRTNTPLQALVTLNEPGFAAAAKELGQRARASSEAQSDQLAWVWLACTGRMADDARLQTLASMLADYRRIADGDESRAWTALCNVLLNLDVTMTLE